MRDEQEADERRRSLHPSSLRPHPLLMRKPVIAGNWKMYKLLAEAVDTALELKPLVANANHCEVVIAPVFTALKTVADRLEGSNISVAAQDCAVQNAFGAHTGEVAASM